MSNRDWDQESEVLLETVVSLCLQILGTPKLRKRNEVLGRTKKVGRAEDEPMSTRHFSNLIDANDIYRAVQQSIVLGVGPGFSYVCWSLHLPVSMQGYGISDIVCDNYVFASGKTFR